MTNLSAVYASAINRYLLSLKLSLVPSNRQKYPAANIHDSSMIYSIFFSVEFTSAAQHWMDLFGVAETDTSKLRQWRRGYRW